MLKMTKTSYYNIISDLPSIYFQKKIVNKERRYQMRKKKKNSPLLPFGAGLAVGVISSLIIAAVGALILSFTDIASTMAGLVAIIATAVGSFLSGRTAGFLKRRNGLETGALCGVIFFAALLILSLAFGTAGTAMLPVKAVICLAFAAAGGVSGVNAAT